MQQMPDVVDSQESLDSEETAEQLFIKEDYQIPLGVWQQTK